METLQTLTRAKFQPVTIPWFMEQERLPKDLPRLLYRRLADEDLLADLIHEKPITEDEFVEFVVGPDTFFYVFLDVANGRYAGLAWLTDLVSTDCFSKACGAFAFFRDYWDPRATRIFGDQFLGQAFNIAGVDVVWGMTPKSNRLATRYSKRMGFRYEATLSNMTCRRGEVTDAMICVQTRSEFNGR